MGWFDWLQPDASNVDVLPNSIWLTDEAKWNGIRAALRDALMQGARPSAVYLVGHFPNSVKKLHDVANDLASLANVKVCLARDLGSACRSGATPTIDHHIEAIVDGRHPHPDHDDQVLRTLKSLPYSCRLACHLSFDDVLLRAFAGKSTRETLRNLGMKEDEPIKSKMVARRLRGAQNQIAKNAIGDSAEDSAEHWLKMNCPTAWEKLRG
jgi:hypothetical protein